MLKRLPPACFRRGEKEWVERAWTSTAKNDNDDKQYHANAMPESTHLEAHAFLDARKAEEGKCWRDMGGRKSAGTLKDMLEAEGKSKKVEKTEKIQTGCARTLSISHASHLIKYDIVRKISALHVLPPLQSALSRSRRNDGRASIVFAIAFVLRRNAQSALPSPLLGGGLASVVIVIVCRGNFVA